MLTWKCGDTRYALHIQSGVCDRDAVCLTCVCMCAVQGNHRNSLPLSSLELCRRYAECADPATRDEETRCSALYIICMIAGLSTDYFLFEETETREKIRTNMIQGGALTAAYRASQEEPGRGKNLGAWGVVGLVGHSLDPEHVRMMASLNTSSAVMLCNVFKNMTQNRGPQRQRLDSNRGLLSMYIQYSINSKEMRSMMVDILGMHDVITRVIIEVGHDVPATRERAVEYLLTLCKEQKNAMTIKKSVSAQFETLVRDIAEEEGCSEKMRQQSLKLLETLNPQSCDGTVQSTKEAATPRAGAPKVITSLDRKSPSEHISPTVLGKISSPFSGSPMPSNNGKGSLFHSNGRKRKSASDHKSSPGPLSTPQPAWRKGLNIQQMTAQMLLPKAIFDRDTFCVKGELGRGSFGQVLKVSLIENGHIKKEDYALKVCVVP